MSKVSDYRHVPVLSRQVVECLAISPGGFYVDCTLGGGGHSAAILEHLDHSGQLLGLDRDQEALAAAGEQLKGRKFTANWQMRQANFSQLPELMDEIGLAEADGILADLGVSSWQLDQPERGFTFRENGPLDMRMDTCQQMSAADLVNGSSIEQLTVILRDFGEERYARRISQMIVERRQEKPIMTTQELADIVIHAMPSASRREKQHPARRTFQALRIAVNKELEELDQLLETAPRRLKPGGRLVVITFHSLEDRRVKETFRRLENPCTCPHSFPVCICGLKPLGRIIHKRGLVADEDECRENPRASSARLRCFERFALQEGDND